MGMIMNSMEDLLRLLGDRKNGEGVFNPYIDHRILNNLRIFFEVIREKNSGILFVGEAPGYLGARITGIPFTSGEVISSLSHPVFEGIRERIFLCRIVSERTASIFWKGMTDNRIIPVVWNAFPFHPHEPDKEMSNRRPAMSELEEGKVYLKMVIDLFKPEKIVGIGRIAKGVLKSIVKDVYYLRHPSRGGKMPFLEGLMALLKDC